MLSTTIRFLCFVSLAALLGCGSSTERAENPTSRPSSRPDRSLAESRSGAEHQLRGSTSIPPGDDFGAGVTRKALADFALVIDAPETYSDRPILVRAEVIDVCKAKGCWIKVTDGQSEARVKFADYAFFLPKDCEGKIAWIEGNVRRQTVSVEEQRHYAAESGTEDPNSIDAPKVLVSFMATGVRLTDR